LISGRFISSGPVGTRGGRRRGRERRLLLEWGEVRVGLEFEHFES
jgi:hypothetical protein